MAWSEIYCHPLPRNHRFPMSKYELLPEQLVHHGIINRKDLFRPKPISEDLILLTHNQNYWERLSRGELSKQEIRRTGFPYSKALVDREIHIMGGTTACTHFALQDGVSLNVAGGTHHAFTDKGEGFCLLNDIGIATSFLLRSGKAERVIIIDLDVHQGNGTAEIFRQNEKVFTFSMHGKNNYPLNKERSDLDIELPDGTSDAFYMEELDRALSETFEAHRPDFAFFQSGVDILAGDKLGRLNVSVEGCKLRDRMVFKKCFEPGAPVVASMGGGYAPKLSAIVNAHTNTFQEAKNIFF